TPAPRRRTGYTMESGEIEARARRARALRAGQARAAAAPARACRGAQAHGDTDQRAQSAVALGVVLTSRSHLPQLAAGDDAGLGARLRHAARVDALEADGPLPEILEAGGRRVPGLSGRAALAQIG